MQNRYAIYMPKEAVEISIIKRWRYYLRYQISISPPKECRFALKIAVVKVIEPVIKGGGAAAERGKGWFSNIEGYAIFESDSMDKVIGMINPFFPFYSQEVHEIIPWKKAKEAILASARMNASRG
jgi:hypothetical protein